MAFQNIQLRSTCIPEENKLDCRRPAFIRESCKRFPVLAAKVVRLRLMHIKTLLDDPELKQMKVIYLVRDPRGTLTSLAKNFGCSSDGCAEPREHCEKISSDLDAFEMFNKLNPGRLYLVKYESLVQDSQRTFRELFHFAGLSYLPYISKTIKEHTSTLDTNPYSTFRNSTDSVDKWKRQLTPKFIERAQRACSKVIEKLDYPII